MVLFPPSCPPSVLEAYSTVPVPSSLRTSVQHDFNVGSFARFRDPLTVISIYDRTDFHSLSHLDIRLRLDAEGYTDSFALIDAQTEASHAIWWVTTTKGSAAYTKDFTDSGHPPITYPGEAFPLWRLHLLTQDLPLQWVNWGWNTHLSDDIREKFPYDPHDPQNPPFTLGFNFSKKEEAHGFYFGPYIIAAPGEYERSNDIELRRNISPVPPWVVRLTQEAATEAGLLAKWWPWFGEEPGTEDIKFQQDYDWDSPKWTWDGLGAGNGTRAARIKRMGTRAGSAERMAAGLWKYCQKAEVFNVSSKLPGLQRGSPGAVPLQGES